jgi:hypothetical protein
VTGIHTLRKGGGDMNYKNEPCAVACEQTESILKPRLENLLKSAHSLTDDVEYIDSILFAVGKKGCCPSEARALYSVEDYLEEIQCILTDVMNVARRIRVKL